MRQLAGLFLLIAFVGTAGAHEIAGDAGTLERLGHEVIGLHHLPVTVILVGTIFALYRMRKRRVSRSITTR